MKFGYARVSTSEQSVDVQVQQLKAAGCDEIFEETLSGAKNDRPQLKALLEKLRHGDVVYVVRLDRLGRRMLKLIELINEFNARGVQFVSLENHLDTTTPMGRLLFNMCAAFTEMERELIRERVRAGLALARRKGRKGGRPKVLTPEKETLLKSLWKTKELSVTQMCQAVGISRSGYYRAINAFESS